MRKRYTSVHMLVKDNMRSTNDWNKKSFGSKSVCISKDCLNQLEQKIGCDFSKARIEFGDSLFSMVLATELLTAEDSELSDIIENISGKFIDRGIKFTSEDTSKISV